MTAWYNEPDPFAAEWLRRLIAGGLIAPGVVDERKIQDVEAWELAKFTQCHFFAGIGVWSYALRQAGWADDRPIWTGSCPCQPFSAAGKQKGFTDDRHLWPTWFALIRQCGPSTIVGEQVASKDGLGWLDLVSTDLEGAGYAFGASDLCAAGFGQAHLRQRLYFVGMDDCERVGRRARRRNNRPHDGEQLGSTGAAIGMGYTEHEGLEGFTEPEHFSDRREIPLRSSASPSGAGGLADSMCAGRQERRTGTGDGSTAWSGGDASSALLHSRETLGRWMDADWLLCRNPSGKPSWRPVESGTFPLAYGVAGRVGLLRAYGNALDAKTATAFAEVVREIADGV